MCAPVPVWARCYLRLGLPAPRASQTSGDAEQGLVEGRAGHRRERAGLQHAVMLAASTVHPDVPPDCLGVRDRDLTPRAVGRDSVVGDGIIGGSIGRRRQVTPASRSIRCLRGEWGALCKQAS